MRTALKLMSMAFVIAFLAAEPVFACPVCFGANDSQMAKGLNMGIWVLFGITALMLTLFGSLFLTIWFRIMRYTKSGGGLTAGPLAHSREN